MTNKVVEPGKRKKLTSEGVEGLGTLELVSEDSRDRRLLRALDVDASGRIPRRVLPDALARSGLRPNDMRLADSMERLAAYPDDAVLDSEQMPEVIRPSVASCSASFVDLLPSAAAAAPVRASCPWSAGAT